MVAEAVGGVITGPLAFIADASFSLFLALTAITIAARPATTNRTDGCNRAEILAALVNGLLLIPVSPWVVYEAIPRLGPTGLGARRRHVAIALIGLPINVAAFWMLYEGDGESLNVKAALRRVLADLAGSVGVMIAAIVILVTEWEPVKALVSILITSSARSILRVSVDVLLEAAPSDIDTEEVGCAMTAPWRRAGPRPSPLADHIRLPNFSTHSRRSRRRLPHDPT